MDWRINFIRKTVKHFLPFKKELRAVKRRLFPYRTELRMDDYLLDHGIQQINLLQAQNIRVEGAVVLEFGSGWNPLIPLIFLLSGAKTVILTDIERLLDAHLLRASANLVAAHWPQLCQSLDLPQDRIGVLGPALEPSTDDGLEDLLSSLHLQYLVPFDIRQLDAASVDIVVSRAVLEHVSVDDLRFYFEEFRRITRKDGANCHIIDNTDHRWHDDPALSPVDFLKYSDRMWKIIDMRGRHNRLRCSEYIALLQQAGWTTRQVERDIPDEARRGLQRITPAGRFASLPEEDLATAISKIVVA